MTYTYGASQTAKLRQEHEQLAAEVQRQQLELVRLKNQVRAERRKAEELRRIRINTQPTEEIRSGAELLIEQLKTLYPEDAQLGPVRLRSAAREANPGSERNLQRGTTAPRDHLGRYAA